MTRAVVFKMWLCILLLFYNVAASPIEESCRNVKPQSFMNGYIEKVERDIRNNNIVPWYEPGGHTVNVSFTPPRCKDHFSYCSNRPGAKCFSHIDICHNSNQCSRSGKDEYKCKEALCFFDREENVQLQIAQTDLPLNKIKNVDTKACAKICLEVPKCRGFEVAEVNLECNIYNEEDLDAPRRSSSSFNVFTLKSEGMKRCAVDQFSCSYTECIPLNWVCDGNIDCSAGADEAICEMSARSFQEDNETNTEYYYDHENVTVTYGGCAFLCSEDKEFCSGFWYSRSRQFCLLSCHNANRCPKEVVTLGSTRGYTFYRRTPLSVMQGLKIAVQILKHVISQLPEPSPVAPSTDLPPPPRVVNSPAPSFSPVAPHWYDTFPRLLSDVQSICGMRHPSKNRLVGPLLFNAANATAGQFPWQVQIQKREGLDFIHQCGGFIITSRHVITAGHCVVENRFSPDGLRIVVGSLKSSRRGTDGKAFPVKDAFFHPRYRFSQRTKQSNEFDVAVIELTTDILFDDNVLPICLPEPDASTSSAHTCWISGFGATTFLGTRGFNTRKSSENMQYAAFNLVPRDTCERELKVDMPEERLCVSGGDSATCEGDSGGPFACKDNRFGDRFFVYGIVHIGSKECSNNSKPSVLINIAKFIDFIKETVGDVQPIPFRG